MSDSGVVEHFFRREYGKLVATLSRRVGVQHVEAVEDAAQGALMVALETWKTSGPPENPSAWLFRVAHNNLIDALRTGAGRRRILAESAADPAESTASEPASVLAGEVDDDLLRMLFVCCDEAIPIESQLVLALKILCGFGVPEIAQRLFTTEANVYKRLGRGRARLRTLSPERSVDALSERGANPSRLPAVQKVLYLLFTEGYLSVHADHTIRRELCDEAIRLTTILAEHSLGRSPETSALLALLHLHRARMSARQDAAGGLLLLEEQDRHLWDVGEIEIGMKWLGESAEGDVYSRYHAEAAIAAEHCLASSFEETNWEKVTLAYELLERAAPSPLHRLNRAVAVAEGQGPHAGLAVLEGFEPPTWLVGSYPWSAVLADLHRRCGNADIAARYRKAAIASAPTGAVRDLLRRRLDPLGG